MFRLNLGRSGRYCDGFSRRSFLQLGVAGMAGVGLPQLLHAKSKSAADGSRKDTSAILLWLDGGPSHLDLYDMKPDAPAEYRGQFQPIATRVPGIQICEHLPRIAGHTDKLAIIRSMTHDNVDHTVATHYLLTGHAVPNRNGPESEDWPNYGAVLSYLGRGQGPLPPFVTMMPRVPDGAPRFVEQSHGRGAGFLGPQYAPLRIDEDASLPTYQVADFSLHLDVPPPRVVYVELYDSNRTDAEIIADQKKDQAKKEAYAKEKQRQFQELEKKLGMD